jgi:hypothetical protein
MNDAIETQLETIYSVLDHSAGHPWIARLVTNRLRAVPLGADEATWQSRLADLCREIEAGIRTGRDE